MRGKPASAPVAVLGYYSWAGKAVALKHSALYETSHSKRHPPPKGSYEVV